MRFTDFFCASPVCSPARASILTGRIPSQHGVHDWLHEGNAEGDGIEYLEGLTALTDHLSAAGYRCGISGKWHLGDSVHPQKSFDDWYVHERGGGPYYKAPMYRDGQAIEVADYITDNITDNALDWLDDYAETETPFYLSVHYTAPHSPWAANQHPDEYLDLYADCPFESVPTSCRTRASQAWPRPAARRPHARPDSPRLLCRHHGHGRQRRPPPRPARSARSA